MFVVWLLFLIQAPTFYPSSKTCSRCGAKNSELKLSDRIFRCTSCGLTIDRDKNAGLNLCSMLLLLVEQKARPLEPFNAFQGAMRLQKP